MNAKEIKKKFLQKLELFYRNFGDEWCVEDFSENENEKNIIKNFLPILSEKKIIVMNDNENCFKIIDLPSKYEDEVFGW